MKLTTAFVALAALAGIGAEAQSVCTTNAARKEIRSMTPAEWSRAANTLKSMQDYGWFQWFAYLHASNFNVIHNCEIFFPWHRRFLLDFESVGRRFDSSFALPYWDEVRDYANPAASAVLSPAYLGGNGAGSNQCVSNGLQSGWAMTYPQSHCLHRQFNNGNTIKPMYSPEYMQSILSRSKDMSQLRPAIEYSLHGAMHLGLGGDMIQTYSPNDFAFWLHHANIDRLWFVWQMQNPNQNFWSMNGADTKGNPVTLSTALPYYGDAIINTMYPSRNGMCFSYENYSTVSRTKRSLSTHNGQKCIPRPAPSLPDLIEGVFDDVNQVLEDSESVVKDTLLNALPGHMLDKWFPTLSDNSTTTYTAADIPEQPVVAEKPIEDNLYSEMSAPYLPSESFEIAGENMGSSYYSEPEVDVTDATEYSGSTADVSTIYTSSAPAPTSDVESASESESGSASESEDYSAAVAIPSHDAQDTYDASEAADYSEDYQIFDFGSSPDTTGLDGQGPAYPMPVPFPLTRGYIEMHKYSIREIKEHYTMAKQFVSDMNGVNFQSPYAKGAKNLTNVN
ncbi:hypothetical protein EV183_002161 [Coemansia sp. RSA 2336]|nr:hypothetical protein EV183_002161 [Coemansia sp. RSA 2336]